MKSVLIVGAGMLGKGFIGEVFDEAENWHVSYLDKDPRVIENLKKPEGFTVECSYEDRTEHRVITDYDAFLTDEQFSAADAAIHADVIMMPLYPEDFDEAIAYLSKMLARRAKENPAQSLDIVCNTNYNHYMNHIRETFLKDLGSDEARKWFEDQVYLSDSIIRRSTIADDNAATSLRTMCCATLLIQPPLHNDLKDVPWMEQKDKIELLKDMKVYTINGMHATSAFAGYLKGYTLIEECMDDPEIVAMVNEVMEEASYGLTREFPITKEEIDDMCAFFYVKLDSPINDAILRVCWDPARKLGRNDRLTGNAMYCYKHGKEPVALMQSMANAMAYDDPRDPIAMEIQKKIQEKGIVQAISEVCGIPADHHITQCVAENYRKLMEKRAK